MSRSAIIFVIFIFILSACGGNHSKPEVHSFSDTIISSSTSTKKETYNGPVDTNAVVEDTTYIPSAPDMLACVDHILKDGGAYHGMEVDSTVAELNWTGLFKSKHGYYTAQTRIRAEHVNDGIIDRDTTKKTGIKITTLHKDTTIVLIAGIDDLPQHGVRSLVTPQPFPHPEDDTIRFEFEGIRYKLYADALRRNDKNDLSVIYYWNYKLYLTGSKNGKDITQVLRAHPSYYEFDKILFIGDLDGDDIPDIVFEI